MWSVSCLACRLRGWSCGFDGRGFVGGVGGGDDGREWDVGWLA